MNQFHTALPNSKNRGLRNFFKIKNPIFLDAQRQSYQTATLFNYFFSDYLESKRAKEINNKHIINDSSLEFDGIDIDLIIESLKLFHSKIKFLLEKIEDFDKNSKVLNELIVCLDELNENIEIMTRIIKLSNNYICWSYLRKVKGDLRISLHCAPRNISGYLKENIFNDGSSGVVCSATLQFDNKFDYFSQELGINQISGDVKTSIYESPFLYNEQMKLFLYKTNVDINSEDYIYDISDQIISYAKKINTRILVLCTSFSQIRKFKKIHDNNGFLSNIFYQLPGSNRSLLIENYLDDENAILFGTSSFWEGVDLPGKSVETLWIIKIPFSNPKEPLFLAQSEKYKINGNNTFMHYSIPDATIKFKQGFGRLIRNLSDYGVCILSDPRLTNKKYGKVILDSLPIDSILYTSINDVISRTEDFFKEFKA